MVTQPQRQKQVYGRGASIHMANANLRQFQKDLKDSADDRKRSFADSLVDDTAQPEPPHKRLRPVKFHIPPLAQPKVKARKRRMTPDLSEPETSPPSKKSASQLPQSSIWHKFAFQNGQKDNQLSTSPPASVVAQPDPSALSMLPSPASSFSETSDMPTMTPAQYIAENPGYISRIGLQAAHDRLTIAPFVKSTDVSAISRLPNSILELILDFALPEREWVVPVYEKGRIVDGLRNDCFDDKNTIGYDNIDLSILRVCKTFHDIGSHTFYGKNAFYFADPDAFDWWLKRIGVINSMKIKNLSLHICSGWIKGSRHAFGHIYQYRMDGHSDHADNDAKCCEAKWLKPFTNFLAGHQELKSISIHFDDWKETRRAWYTKGCTEADCDVIARARGQLLRILDERVREIKRVELSVGPNGQGMTTPQRQIISLKMMQSKTTLPPKAPPMKWSLEDVLGSVRAIRVNRESRLGG